MSKEKLANKEASSEEKNSTVKWIDMKEIKEISLDNSSGFVCDINTGICGPVNNRKED
ncbi:hypothetical protein [Ornithinibacillus scapharcae]|uniref:hypothetical protein n=1 Tax=Ornithinibacillus scapharcae TaxID=1147159 RepID=UPI000225B376|nr:hypothetical protein [Ornithinibacillus scapharcae]